jgi:hypothetical protein
VWSGNKITYDKQFTSFQQEIIFAFKTITISNLQIQILIRNKEIQYFLLQDVYHISFASIYDLKARLKLFDFKITTDL